MSQKPRYHCPECHDSGAILKREAVRFERGGELRDSFEVCTSCDGKSRLGGEVDEEIKSLAETLSGDTL